MPNTDYIIDTATAAAETADVMAEPRRSSRQPSYYATYNDILSTSMYAVVHSSST